MVLGSVPSGTTAKTIRCLSKCHGPRFTTRRLSVSHLNRIRNRSVPKVSRSKSSTGARAAFSAFGGFELEQLGSSSLVRLKEKVEVAESLELRFPDLSTLAVKLEYSS
ncbi:hypothetical protein M569_13401 [Genlisea aurea]|uniref:Uncharacterized protein n=1 Tax=Genlisea aurea TaxID=192259 RepID=S8DNY8_9LAMI|nr:hypothetical protein M569_13401 [Genlisea aurea]